MPAPLLPGQPQPQTTPTVFGPTDSTNPLDYLNKALPGIGSVATSATDVIANLLRGTPSPSTARLAAATFGARAGQGPGSGISDVFGYDLYNQMGQQRQQQGIQDLLSTLGSFAGTLTPSQSQLLQNQQFGASLLNQQEQFNQTEQDRQNQQLMALMGQLGMNN